MKNMKIYCVVTLGILCIFGSASGQGSYSEPFKYDRSSFFVMVGYLDGPNFSDYVDWANQYYADTYGSTDKMHDFKSTFCFSVGLRTRFSQYFAFEVDFLTSAKKSKEVFYSADGNYNYPITLDLNVGAITASVPILFQFSRNQRVVPFIAAGATVFPFGLDHTASTTSYIYTDRLTKTALAFNFSLGAETKISRKMWLTARIDRTLGKASMPVNQMISSEPDNFDIDLSTTQIQCGIMYSFQ